MQSPEKILLHSHLHIQAGHILTQWITDAGRPLRKIFTSHFIARVRKVCVGFYCERELEAEHNWNILTPNLWPSALCFSRSLGLLNWSPGVHSTGCWLSLQHLISNSIGVPSAGCGFPYHTSSISVSNSTAWHLSWLSYIIVQHPLDGPCDLWNRMFNRHQAEITVMQFRVHSLPVRQSMRV